MPIWLLVVCLVGLTLCIVGIAINLPKCSNTSIRGGHSNAGDGWFFVAGHLRFSVPDHRSSP